MHSFPSAGSLIPWFSVNGQREAGEAKVKTGPAGTCSALEQELLELGTQTQLVALQRKTPHQVALQLDLSCL